MKKMIFLGLAAATVFAGAAPAAAQPRGGGYGYDRYDNGYDTRDQRRGRTYGGCTSLTDRDCDGFDDRDLNFDRYIDASERRGAGRGGAGRRSYTDRNGDGFDDRDLNRDGRISQREARIPVRGASRDRRY